MRILKILPGTGGGFLFESGLRDQALVAELRWAGHDVLLLPLYLPIPGAPGFGGVGVPLFYGAARIYLEHRYPFFRRSPARFRRWLDSPRLLRWASRVPSHPPNHARADLTLSLLRGENGGQVRELDALCDWLREQPRPDIVHLSNALLLGLARRVGSVLEAPVVCSLHDEDTWVDAMPMPVAKRTWSEIRARAPGIGGFIATSHYYAAKMPRRMGMALRNVRVVHPGIESPPAATLPDAPPSPPVWGVLLGADDTEGLTRVCRAFQALRRQPACASLRLRLAGPVPSSTLLSAIEARDFTRDIEIWPRFSRHSELSRFVRSLTVFTSLHRDEPAFNLELLEAMARGVAVVQPASGSNPEILELAEGGLLFDPDVPHALENAVSTLVSDPAHHAATLRRGRHGVEQQFSLPRMARETVEIYQGVCAKYRGKKE